MQYPQLQYGRLAHAQYPARRTAPLDSISIQKRLRQVDIARWVSVARLLGHSDTSMVKKHYGRWIPTDTKSMAALVSQMMGFRDADRAYSGL